MTDRFARRALLPLYALVVVLAVMAVVPPVLPATEAAITASPPATIEPLFAVPPAVGSFVGARVTSSRDLPNTDGSALAFDTVLFDRGGFVRSPTTLCVPTDGFYRATLTITTLGTDYGHPSNADVRVAVGIVGATHGHLAYVRSHNPGSHAELTEAVSPPTWLFVGTCLEATVSAGVYVEANWLDRGSTLSPVFALEYLGD